MIRLVKIEKLLNDRDNFLDFFIEDLVSSQKYKIVSSNDRSEIINVDFQFDISIITLNPILQFKIKIANVFN
jgi:hypothetical protein